MKGMGGARRNANGCRQSRKGRRFLLLPGSALVLEAVNCLSASRSRVASYGVVHVRTFVVSLTEGIVSSAWTRRLAKVHLTMHEPSERVSIRIAEIEPLLSVVQNEVDGDDGTDRP